MQQFRPNVIRMPQVLYLGILVLTALSLVMVAAPNTNSYAAEVEPGVPDLSNSSLAFIANEGQTDPEVAFHVHSMGGALFFTPREVVFSLPVSDEASFVMRQDFIGANANPRISGLDQQASTMNFFTGNTPDKWLTDVATYGGLRYDSIYPGIDLRFEGTEGVLKSAYMVEAGADPSVIQWRYRGIDQTRIDPATGDLKLVLDDELELVERAPVAWQTINGERVMVDIGYTLTGAGNIGFALGNYDPDYDLVLDPELQYSTYLGGYMDDQGYDVVVDHSGNAYVTGVTMSITFPTANAYQYDPRGSSDIFIAKLNVSISSQKMLYGTFLGGIGDETGYGIAVNDSGEVYLTGETTSTDFPGTFSYDFGGASDAFVTKLNANGMLLYSSYLGGSLVDRGQAIAIDASGNSHVAGFTESANFPTANAAQAAYGTNRDAFVTKLTGDLSGIVYSTYLGGAGADEATSITVDDSGQAYVVGHTGGTFPTAGTPFQASNNGGTDAFVATFGTTGAFVYSTYYGGTGNDYATGVVSDATGNAYITGWTTSTDLVLSPAPLQGTNASAEDVFIIELDATGTNLLYGTYLGGGGLDKAADITRDPQGIIHITGETRSSDYPLFNPFPGQEVFNGGTSDAFVTALDLQTNSYFYSSFLGGDADDSAQAIDVDDTGGIYLTGSTGSTDFPLVNKAFQRGGHVDAFIVKVGSSQADLVITKSSDVVDAIVGGQINYTIEVTNNGPNDTNGVVVQDFVPPQLSINAVTGAGSCQTDGNTITCGLGTILVDQTVAINIATTANQKGMTTNTAKITQSSEFDPVTPNVASASVLVDKLSDLEVEMAASRYRVMPGNTFDLIITLTNNGPSSTDGVALQVGTPDQILPPELTLVSAIPSSGTLFRTDLGRWDVGAMTASRTIQLTLTVRLKTEVGGVPVAVGTVIVPQVTNVTGIETDPDTTNNAASLEVIAISEMFPAYGCAPSEADPDVIICVTGNSD